MHSELEVCQPVINEKDHLVCRDMNEHPQPLTISGLCYHGVKMRGWKHAQFFRWTFSLIQRKLDDVPDFTLCALAEAALFVFSTLCAAASFTFAILLFFRPPWEPPTSSSKCLSYWSAQPKPFESCLSYDAIAVEGYEPKCTPKLETMRPNQQETNTLSERKISTRSAKTSAAHNNVLLLRTKLSLLVRLDKKTCATKKILLRSVCDH